MPDKNAKKEKSAKVVNKLLLPNGKIYAIGDDNKNKVVIVEKSANSINNQKFIVATMPSIKIYKFWVTVFCNQSWTSWNLRYWSNKSVEIKKRRRFEMCQSWTDTLVYPIRDEIPVMLVEEVEKQNGMKSPNTIKARWKRLVPKPMRFPRPKLNLNADSARRMIDSRGKLGMANTRRAVWLAALRSAVTFSARVATSREEQ